MMECSGNNAEKSSDKECLKFDDEFFHYTETRIPEPSLNPYVQQNLGFPGLVNFMNPYAGYHQINPNKFGMPAINLYQQMDSEVKQINPESLPIPLNRSIPRSKSNDPRLLKAAAALKRPMDIEDKPRQKPTSTSTDFVEMKKKKLNECKIDVAHYLQQMSHQITTAAETTDGICNFVELMLDSSKQIIRAMEDLKRAMNTPKATEIADPRDSPPPPSSNRQKRSRNHSPILFVK